MNHGVPSVTAIRYFCERYVKKKLFAYTIDRVPMRTIKMTQMLVTNGWGLVWMPGPTSDSAPPPVLVDIRFPQLEVRVLFRNLNLNPCQEHECTR